MIKYDDFEILTFDCYGTLIDWETGILAALKPVLSNHEITTTDDQVLELYAEVEARLEKQDYQPYRTVLRQVVARLGEALNFRPTPEEMDVLADSLGQWPAFPDTVPALKALKTKYKLGIISNIDNDLFAETNKTLQVEFDHIVTAAQVRAYKPSHKAFDLARELINLPRAKILHVAQSLFHDHVPAKELGYTTVWINRRAKQAGGGATPPASALPDAEFPDMASFARAAGVM